MTAETQRRRDPLMWAGALRGLLDRPLASYYLLLASSALLLVIGLAMVFSATSVTSFGTSGNAYDKIIQQVIAAVVGIAAFWVCQRLPRRTFRALAPTAVLIALALLIIMDGLAVLAAAKVIPAPRIGPIESETIWL
ncbi:MAG TPA: FtsW/RodA/SpoVE family cell cycle protein, partial [Candidatus Limnocylindrales bacterium]